MLPYSIKQPLPVLLIPWPSAPTCSFDLMCIRPHLFLLPDGHQSQPVIFIQHASVAAFSFYSMCISHCLFYWSHVHLSPHIIWSHVHQSLPVLLIACTSVATYSFGPICIAPHLLFCSFSATVPTYSLWSFVHVFISFHLIFCSCVHQFPLDLLLLCVSASIFSVVSMCFPGCASVHSCSLPVLTFSLISPPPSPTPDVFQYEQV